MPHHHTSNTASNIEHMADDTLIQLVYISSLSLIGRLNPYIFEHVESHAKAYNQQHGITGILCYGNGCFLQCIEGEKQKVMALQQRIAADKRHKDFTILLLQKIERRSFSDWRMRLLFLERWLWSPATKRQAEQLSPFLPFAPSDWRVEHTEQFLQVIKEFDSPPHIQAAGITYNALGNMMRHIAAPHQAFLLVQGFLGVLLIIALVMLLS